MWVCCRLQVVVSSGDVREVLGYLYGGEGCRGLIAVVGDMSMSELECWTGDGN